MAIVDTKPNLNSCKFEQCVGDTLGLSGITNVFGSFNIKSNGCIDSINGYKISGNTILKTKTTDINSIFIGSGAGSSVGNGISNIAIGSSSLYNNQSGCYNIAIGYNTLHDNITGCYNIANGYCALYANISGSSNIAIGNRALASNTIGHENIALGCLSLYNNQSGSLNVAIGYYTLFNNIKGCNNIANGYCALFGNISGSTNIAIGDRALACNKKGCENIAIGQFTLVCNDSGRANIALGSDALFCNTSGIYNIAIGVHSLFYNTSGSDNVALGYFSLNCNTTGCENIAIGTSALNNNTTGCYNISFGYHSLYFNQNGTDNIAIGHNVLYNNISGAKNIGIGVATLINNSSGQLNVALGYNALTSNTIGNDNIAIGTNALLYNTSGCFNIAYGFNALRCNVTGCNNVAIGELAGYYVTGSSNVMIGSCAGYYERKSNKLYIANCGECSLIYGEFDNKILCINARTYITNLTSGSTAKAVYYNPTTHELSYGGAFTGSSNNVSGEKVSKIINKTSHGFNVGDVIGWSGGTYNKAIAKNSYDGETIGIVSKVVDSNNFELTQSGYITGLTGLVTNTTYFLSSSTPGQLTSTKPSSDGDVVKAVLVANSSTTGWVLPYPGYVVSTGNTGTVEWGQITGNITGQTDLMQQLTYCLNSPSTCTVGGITAGTVLTGKTMMCLLQDILAPYIIPTFSAFDMTGTFPIEVGSVFSGSKTFTWSTTTSSNVATNSIGIAEVGGSVLCTGLANTGSASVNIGSKTNTSPTTWTWRISGCSTQHHCFTRDVSKCSIYPYYYGKLTSGSRPPVTNSLVTGGTKVVGNSNGTVTVNFNSASNEYTWLAIPAASTSKTCWYRTALDNGRIASSPSDKYPDECIISISSGQGCWSNVNYKVYMSDTVGEITTAIEFRNS